MHDGWNGDYKNRLLDVLLLGDQKRKDRRLLKWLVKLVLSVVSPMNEVSLFLAISVRDVIAIWKLALFFFFFRKSDEGCWPVSRTVVVVRSKIECTMAGTGIGDSGKQMFAHLTLTKPTSIFLT